jgi:hypothetical protein
LHAHAQPSRRILPLAFARPQSRASSSSTHQNHPSRPWRPTAPPSEPPWRHAGDRSKLLPLQRRPSHSSSPAALMSRPSLSPSPSASTRRRHVALPATERRFAGVLIRTRGNRPPRGYIKDPVAAAYLQEPPRCRSEPPLAPIQPKAVVLPTSGSFGRRRPPVKSEQTRASPLP